jgi:hypothetical protein
MHCRHGHRPPCSRGRSRTGGGSIPVPFRAGRDIWRWRLLGIAAAVVQVVSALPALVDRVRGSEGGAQLARKGPTVVRRVRARGSTCPIGVMDQPIARADVRAVLPSGRKLKAPDFEASVLFKLVVLWLTYAEHELYCNAVLSSRYPEEFLYYCTISSGNTVWPITSTCSDAHAMRAGRG